MRLSPPRGATGHASPPPRPPSGRRRPRALLAALRERAQELQVGLPASVTTPYVNTIPVDQQAWFPGDEHLERRIRAFIRWNAAVLRVGAHTPDARRGRL